MSLTERFSGSILEVISLPRRLFENLLSRLTPARGALYLTSTIFFAAAAASLTINIRAAYKAVGQSHESLRSLLLAKVERGSSSSGLIDFVVLSRFGASNPRPPHPLIVDALRDVQLAGQDIAAQMCRPAKGSLYRDPIQQAPANLEAIWARMRPCLPASDLIHATSSRSQLNNARSWGSAWCDRPIGIVHGSVSFAVSADHLTLLGYPVTHASESASTEPDAGNSLNRALEREQAVLCAASVLAYDGGIHERLQQLAETSLPGVHGSLQGQVVQVYFAGQGGVFSEWDRRQGEAELLIERPLFHHETASYVQRVARLPMGDTNVQSTLPYVDYGGWGLVQTHCAGVFYPHYAPDMYPNRRSSVFLGAICLDQTIDESVIRSELLPASEDPAARETPSRSRDHLFRTWLIRSQEVLRMQQGSAPSQPGLEALAEWLKTHGAEQSLDDESHRHNEPIPVGMNGESGVLAPFVSNVSGAYDWIYVVPRDLAPPVRGFWGGGRVARRGSCLPRAWSWCRRAAGRGAGDGILHAGASHRHGAGEPAREDPARQLPSRRTSRSAAPIHG